MFPEHAPFNVDQRTALASVLSNLQPMQKVWLSGYLAAGVTSAAPMSTPAQATALTVLYGTESGNAEGLADKAVKAGKKKGFKAVMKNMADIKPADLSKLENVMVIVSTWGDGEPPEGAETFYNDLMANTVDLKGVKFSVCALGDTSYDKFCQTGKEMDARLEALGAQRVIDRVDCDIDFDDAYAAWEKEVFSAMAPATVAEVPAMMDFGSVASGISYSKKNPFPSEVLENILLNGEGSAKETVHVELSLDGSGLDYEAGDALAVVPTNCANVVTDILNVTGLNAQNQVVLKTGEEISLEEALTSHLDVTALSRAVLKKYQALVNADELERLLGDDAKQELKDWMWGRQVIDALEAFPLKGLTADQLVSVLRKLPPRLYSIASSPKAHPGEVHLTVAAVRYDTNGRSRKGVASTYLADEAKAGDKVAVYVHKNKNFRLPENDDVPVIMVGPGTGIAPFRAFIEERSETEATGGSWLFFGDQRYTFDFLYQLELQEHLKSGALTHLDVAFSRDQPEKVYVQDKIREQAAELYAWLEKGAHFYVCGDASRMASDVHDALIDVVAEQGRKSREEAEAYVDALKKDKRYQRDVY